MRIRSGRGGAWVGYYVFAWEKREGGLDRGG